MKIVLIGIQGSGKSTQGNLLQEKLHVPFLSAGQIFREIAKEQTPLAVELKKFMTAGELIPDQKVLEIISAYLHKPAYQDGYILDGFPRTVAQAQAFGDGVDYVLYLQVSDKEALKRISSRHEVGREDETVEAITRRIELFHTATEPVIAYYREKNKLIEVDGELAIEAIHTQILTKLETAKHG